MHPDWQNENGANFLDDVAVIQLDAPVTNVAPVPLGPDPAPPRVTVLGRGASTHSGRRAGTLREATQRTVGDRACARQYRRATGNDGERFSSARMVCSRDVNGRRPLSSACFGDSGGPLFGGTMPLRSCTGSSASAVTAAAATGSRRSSPRSPATATSSSPRPRSGRRSPPAPRRCPARRAWVGG